MERLKIEDIFKPGGEKLIRTGPIDFDDPANAALKELFEQTKKRQEELRARMEWKQEDYDALRNVITI